MKLIDLYYNLTKDTTLNEANLKQLYTKSVNETPKMAARGKQLENGVRYFGLSEDGTWNFKVKSQSQKGKYYYVYIESEDLISFGNIIEEGDVFTTADLQRLLTLNGFRVHCNCPAFLYWTFQYMATQGNYEIEPEMRAPKRNNTLLKGGLCKHLQAVVYNIFNNKEIQEQIASDINNYLRALLDLDHDDYQQLNHARQIKQQNRAVKWKTNPSDFMNDYFARQAKQHPFLDDHDIKKSLKKEVNKFVKSNTNATVDDFLKDYFSMTQKAFAEDMDLPEESIVDYFNEIGFEEKKNKAFEKQQAKLNQQTKEEPIELPEEPNQNEGLNAGILTKDSEQLQESSLTGDKTFDLMTQVANAFGWKLNRRNKTFSYIVGSHGRQVGSTSFSYPGKIIFSRTGGIYKNGYFEIEVPYDFDDSSENYEKLVRDIIEGISVYMREDNKLHSLKKKQPKTEQLSLFKQPGTYGEHFNESQKFYKDSEEAKAAYKDYIKGHVSNVNAALGLLSRLDIPFVNEHLDELKEICSVHDDSKYSDKEFFPYLHHFYPVNEEEAELEEEFDQAVSLHVRNNRHHWNCDDWIDPVTGNLKGGFDRDLYLLHTVERCCDWLAMAYQHDEPPADWYDKNKVAIIMPDYAKELTEEIMHKVPEDFELIYKVTRGSEDE